MAIQMKTLLSSQQMIHGHINESAVVNLSGQPHSQTHTHTHTSVFSYLTSLSRGQWITICLVGPDMKASYKSPSTVGAVQQQTQNTGTLLQQERSRKAEAEHVRVLYSCIICSVHGRGIAVIIENCKSYGRNEKTRLENNLAIMKASQECATSLWIMSVLI